MFVGAVSPIGDRYTLRSVLCSLQHRVLTGPSRGRIVTWIDANAPYYGTYRGKRNLYDKDDPNFRALPLVGK